MIKLWKVRVQLFWDAGCVKTYMVKANTKRKAEQFAITKAKKEHNCRDMIKVLSVEEVTNENTN